MPQRLLLGPYGHPFCRLVFNLVDATTGSQPEAETSQPSRGQQTHRLRRTTVDSRPRLQKNNTDHCQPQFCRLRLGIPYHALEKGLPSAAQWGHSNSAVACAKAVIFDCAFGKNTKCFWQSWRILIVGAILAEHTTTTLWVKQEYF
jgi:hypothetical protein